MRPTSRRCPRRIVMCSRQSFLVMRDRAGSHRANFAATHCRGRSQTAATVNAWSLLRVPQASVAACGRFHFCSSMQRTHATSHGPIGARTSLADARCGQRTLSTRAVFCLRSIGIGVFSTHGLWNKRGRRVDVAEVLFACVDRSCNWWWQAGSSRSFRCMGALEAQRLVQSTGALGWRLEPACDEEWRPGSVRSGQARVEHTVEDLGQIDAVLLCSRRGFEGVL